MTLTHTEASRALSPVEINLRAELESLRATMAHWRHVGGIEIVARWHDEAHEDPRHFCSQEPCASLRNAGHTY